MIWKTRVDLDKVNNRQSIVVVHGDKQPAISTGTKYDLCSILRPGRFIAWCYESELTQEVILSAMKYK